MKVMYILCTYVQNMKFCWLLIVINIATTKNALRNHNPVWKKKVWKKPSYVSNTDAGITPKYHEPNVSWFSVFGWTVGWWRGRCETWALNGLNFLFINLFQNLSIFHSSLKKQPPEEFCKKSVLKHFTIFTEKHLRWSLFLISIPHKLCEWLILPWNSGVLFDVLTLKSQRGKKIAS